MSRGRNAEGANIVPLATAAITLAETIRVALAEEIITGRLAPGSEIEEQQAAERFGASRSARRCGNWPPPAWSPSSRAAGCGLPP